MIAGHETRAPRHSPDLEEMDGLVGLVLLGVRDASAARGELHVAAFHAVEEIFVVTAAVCVFFFDHAVPMRQLAAEDVAEDLRVSVRVRREPAVWRDAIFIEHAQGPEAGVARVVVAGEAEGVVRV